MAEVKWIKLDTSMFDNAKIKFIRTLPQGNDILLIWIMILVRAGKCNAGGYIFLTENIPYTDTTLSHELDMPPNVIKLALETFKKLDMITQDEKGFTYIVGWSEHQNFEGMEKIREQNRIRKKNQREKQKLLANNHVTSRDSHATDIDKELDIDIDKEKELYHKGSDKEENKNDDEEDEKQFYNSDYSKITQLFLKSGMGTISNSVIADALNDIADSYPYELIEEAFKRAAINHVKSIRYPEKILIGWKEKGITTLQQLQEYEADKKGGSNGGNKPDIKKEPTPGPSEETIRLNEIIKKQNGGKEIQDFKCDF